MRMPISSLRMETRASPPLQVDDARVYLRAQAVQLRLPFVHGGLIWNRPASVVVRRGGGQEQVLPVPDVTRNALIGLLALNLVAAFVFLLFRRKNA